MSMFGSNLLIKKIARVGKSLSHGLLPATCYLLTATCYLSPAMAYKSDEVKRVYIYGGAVLHFPVDVPGLEARGGIVGPTGGLGFRFAEYFRAELDYENLKGEYALDETALFRYEGHFGFVNFIFDAKLPGAYGPFKTSPFVPFVGFGAGGGKSDIKMKESVMAAYNYIAGVSVEINRTMAVQIAYKYIRFLPGEMLEPWAMEDFAPISHNIGATFRMDF